MGNVAGGILIFRSTHPFHMCPHPHTHTHTHVTLNTTMSCHSWCSNPLPYLMYAPSASFLKMYYYVIVDM